MSSPSLFRDFPPGFSCSSATELLGSGVFGFVQNDIRSNVAVRPLPAYPSPLLTDRLLGCPPALPIRTHPLPNTRTARPSRERRRQQDRHGVSRPARPVRMHISLSPDPHLLTEVLCVCDRSGLSFTCCALMHMQNDPRAELYICFKRSYDEVLRHHHSFIVRSVVTVSSPSPPLPFP